MSRMRHSFPFYHVYDKTVLFLSTTGNFWGQRTSSPGGKAGKVE